jgi:hypothetical protein
MGAARSVSGHEVVVVGEIYILTNNSDLTRST